jgi:tRNA dimethylallyltransferase
MIEEQSLPAQGLPKIVVILGPTAAGKTAWSLNIAEKFSGGIISADSRQVYKKMDIGTAKEPGEWKWWWTSRGPRRSYMVGDIPHHLIDFLDPGKRFTVAQFRDRALKYIKLHLQQGSLPMVVGGTGLYISSVVDNLHIPQIPANSKLRRSLEEKDEEQLHILLQKIDPVSAEQIDQRNKRRMIRALEVSMFSGTPFSEQRKKGDPLFDVLQIGVAIDRELLYDRINQRVDMMMEAGLLDEIEALMKQKYSWELSSMSGVGYRQFQPYLAGECSLEDAVERLKRDTRHYARRQMTWFKRDKRIVWCSSYEEAEAHVAAFLGRD